MNRLFNARSLAHLSTTLVFSFVVYNLYDAFIHTWHYSIWVDEILTLRTIFSSPEKIVESLYNQGPKGYSTDYFPPLYYIIVHYLHKMGLYEFGIRLANNTFVLLSFIFITNRMSSVNSRTIALCFIATSSVSVYFLDLFRLIRPYTIYYCLQICAITSIYVGILRKDTRSIMVAGMLNSISLYSHYATIGNIIGEIGYFLIFYLIRKDDRKFNLQAILILLACSTAFIPWLPGYLNALKSAAAEFGPSQIAIGKIFKVGELIPAIFSHNAAVVVIYGLLALSSAFLMDKRIVAVTLAWGLTPGVLIAINGHPLYIRHLATLGACILLLSAFSLTRLSGMIDSRVIKSIPDHSLTGLALSLLLAFSIGAMTNDDKERHYAAETAPYKSQALDICLNFPKTDFLFTMTYDTYVNTVLRWYLGDVMNAIYSNNFRSDKNVLILKQDNGINDERYPVVKRMPELAGMSGFIVSSLKLTERNPLSFDSDRTSSNLEYLFSDYKVLEYAFSWNNVLVDTMNKTLEPANRLEDAEIVFQFHLQNETKANFFAVLQGVEEIGTDDSYELLVSSDNVDYRPLSALKNNKTKDNHFSLKYTVPFDRAGKFYIKLQMKPGMTRPCAVLKSLTFNLNRDQTPLVSHVDSDVSLVSPSDTVMLMPSMADFGQADPTNSRYMAHDQTEIFQIIAPHFDENFDMEHDLFSKSNLRIKSKEGCLTCSSEGPCHFTYDLHSPTEFRSIKLIFYPRIFNDKSKANYVKVSYSYDGNSYHSIWSTKNDGGLHWFGQREGFSIPLKGGVRDLLLRFELYSEGSQVQSFDNHTLYIAADAYPDDNQSTQEGQEAYLKTVKRLLGL